MTDERMRNFKSKSAHMAVLNLKDIKSFDIFNKHE